MPFIDDALLWCPDNDGRIVGGLDIATCMQDEVNESNENVSESTQLAESTTAELNALEPSLCNNDSSDDLFRQLTESNFEIESLLSDLATVEVKEENNNVSDVSSDVVVQSQHDGFAALVCASEGVDSVVNSGGNVTTCNSNISPGSAIQLPGENSALGSVGTNSLTLEPTAASSTQEQSNCSSFLNQHTSNNNNSNLSNNNEGTTIFDDSSSRYLIASNPLLAEKLMSKSLILNKNDKTIGDFKAQECSLNGNRLVLECDGTDIDDNEVLEYFLKDKSILMVLNSDETWRPDGIFNMLKTNLIEEASGSSSIVTISDDDQGLQLN